MSSIAIQSSGRIIVAENLNEYGYGMRRVNDDGSVDASFGTNGVASIIGGTYWSGIELFLDTDDKITLVGDLDGSIAFMRFEPNGAPDETFGTAGKVKTDFGNSSDSAAAAILQPDGKVVLAG